MQSNLWSFLGCSVVDVVLPILVVWEREKGDVYALVVWKLDGSKGSPKCTASGCWSPYGVATGATRAVRALCPSGILSR